MRLFGLLLVWFLVISVGGKTLVHVDFLFHQDQIALEQCEERFLENSCCHGQCVLKKRLDAADTPMESSGDERNAPSMPELLWVRERLSPLHFLTEDVRILRFCAVNEEITEGFTFPIEKPPSRTIFFSAV